MKTIFIIRLMQNRATFQDTYNLILLINKKVTPARDAKCSKAHHQRLLH